MANWQGCFGWSSGSYNGLLNCQKGLVSLKNSSESKIYSTSLDYWMFLKKYFLKTSLSKVGMNFSSCSLSGVDRIDLNPCVKRKNLIKISRSSNFFSTLPKLLNSMRLQLFRSQK
ncbi:MAG TPA: hypothetical protein DIW81_25085 [Planctomycetaceae bacterium]|nr:hypothetical protein [Rubinisphaera sp.]HCS54821.1 hypothetical protein [Planctomycetaceae bacterium]